MLIRYFAQTDERSAIGALALAYADVFAAMHMEMRIIPTAVAFRGLDQSRWDRHRALFMTPVPSRYVNVVCGSATDWMKFFTVGVRNVLVVPPGIVPTDRSVTPDDTTTKALRVAAQYDAVIAPDEETAAALLAVGVVASVVSVDLAASARALTAALYDTH